MGYELQLNSEMSFVITIDDEIVLYSLNGDVNTWEDIRRSEEEKLEIIVYNFNNANVKVAITGLAGSEYFETLKIQINGNDLILPRSYVDDGSENLIFEDDSVNLNELYIVQGNLNELTIPIFDPNISITEDYTSYVTFIEGEETDVEIDEEEDQKEDHKADSNPVEKVKAEARGIISEAKKSKRQVPTEIIRSNNTGLPASILSQGNGEIRLGVDASLFLNAVKKYKDFKSAKKTKEGESFLKFLEDKGYEVRSIKYAAGSKKTLEIIVKERKELLKYEERRKIETVEALYSFNRVASLLLTEPYLYIDDEGEARRELERIQDIFGEKILPVFYQTLESAACGISHGYNITEQPKVKEAFKAQLEEEVKDLLKSAGEEIDKDIFEEQGLLLVGGIALCLLAPIALPLVGLAASGTVLAGVAVTAASSAAFTLYEIYNSDENIIHNNKRIRNGILCLSRYLEGAGYSDEDYISQTTNAISFVADPEEENKRKELSKKILAQAIAKTGVGGAEINGAINMITGRFFAATPAFKHFEDIIYKIGASSALNLLLKPDKLVETENTYEYPTNLYSEQIIGEEASEYLYYLLAFPWFEYNGIWPNIKDAVEIWKQDSAEGMGIELLDEDRGESDNYFLTYNQSKRDFLEKKTLFNIIFNKSKDKEIAENEYKEDIETLFGKAFFENFFEKNRSKIKRKQEEKIKFLLALRDALVQEVIASNAIDFYEDPKLRKFVERFSKGSVFKIADTTAYPDIDLPHLGKWNFQKPDFYYFNPGKISSEAEDKKAVSRIIKKSHEFKEDLRKHIVTNKPLELGGEVDISSPSALVSQSGTKVRPIGKPKATFKSKIKNFDLETLSLSELPINFTNFKDAKEVSTYIDNKKEEIKEAERTLSSLTSAIGQRNFDSIINKKEVNERLKETKDGTKKYNLEKLSELLGFSQEIDYNNPEELEKLALESNETEMFNLGMAKAFPTFRLYLVEEDSIYSDKLTVYDDFSSYSSVISFRVSNSRELPAATAQVVLQNVSGVLDGSKKEVLRDIDVDGKQIISNDDDAFVKDIDSIVLRPGVNVQLRAGYEANCNNLEILISGRITETQYSNDGMTTNITIQSYGVELDKKIEKNLSRNNKNNIFYSTHQLLGSLILSTQLKHFGRIKRGKIFQDGENKSAAIDNRMPLDSSKFTYYYSNIFTRTLSDNAKTIVFGLAGIALIKGIGGPIFKRFQWFNSGTAYTKRIIGQGWRGFNQFIDNGGLGVKIFFGVPRNIARLGYRFSTAAIKRSPLNRTTTGVKKDILDNILKKIKSGSVTNVSQLTIKEQYAIQSLKSQVLATPNLNKAIQEIITRKGLAGNIIETEIEILALAIQEQGFAFQLSNFSARGLGLATSALTELEIATAAALKAAQKTGFLNTTGRIIKGAVSSTGRAIQNTFAITVGAGVSIGLVGLYADMIYNGIEGVGNIVGDVWEDIFGEEEDDTLRILLSPQDDNLFLPDSRSYLRTEKTKKEGNLIDYFGGIKLPLINVARFGSEMLSVATFNISDLLLDTAGIDVSSLLEKRFKEFKTLFDTRLNIDSNENIYFLKGQTIFNVFHEMSLRHPGYVYGARPMGDSMEYRMFFGLPSQRYWAEDISTVDALRVNKILREYSKDENGLLSFNTCMLYYPERTQAEMKKLFEETNPSELLSWKMISEEKKKEKKKEKAVRFEITKIALNEYIKKTKKRFVPFRKMHVVSSEKNIVANNIIVSGHDVINTVSVNYTLLHNNGDELEKTDTTNKSMYAINLSSNTAIPPELQRPKTFSSENVVGPAAAYRYAIGQLMYGAKNMYQGSVLTLGNPKINPWDVLIINDNVNRMYGPVEVKTVNHMFSHETGFLTDVEVNALVTYGEDSLTYPMIMSSVLGQAKEQIFNDFSSRAEFSAEADEAFYENLIEGIIEDSFSEELDEKARLELKKILVAKVREEMSAAKESKRPFFLRDVLENDISLPEELKRDVEKIGEIGLEGAGLYAGAKVIKYAWSRFVRGISQTSVGPTSIRGPGGVGFLVFLAGSAALRFNARGITNSLEGSLNSGRLGKNLFRPVLMSKVSNQSLIEVYPLVKDGKQLVAGGFEGVPASQSYHNVLGNIYCDISDGLTGYIKHKDRIEKRGAASIYSFDEDFIVRKESKYEKIAEGGFGSITKTIYRGAMSAFGED